MRVVNEYSHFGGTEIMQVRYPDWNSEINRVIADVKAPKSKSPETKKERDNPRYSAIGISAQFQSALADIGYQELRAAHVVVVPGSTATSPGAFTRIDFAKEKVLVQVQFGEYASIFYDLAKFQYFFNENKCAVGVEIVPCHELKQKMSGGDSYGEQLVDDMERQKLNFPLVPIKVTLIDADD
jgi:hypothetical protein